MEYVLPGELSNKLWVSLKTIYNHLSKHNNKIRIKKEYWKTFVHSEDFVRHFESTLQFYNPPTTLPAENNTNSSLWIPDPDVSKIQKDYNIVLQKTEELQKYNTNLQDQVSKYALLLSDEKQEKKDILNRFEALQNNYNEKIEQHALEKINRAKKLYLANGFGIFCLVIILATIGYLTFPYRRRW